MNQERLGIVRIDSLHFFVRELARSREHYGSRLGFEERAVEGPEFAYEHRARASLLEAGEVRFLFLSPLAGAGECARWLASHPEGVGRIVLEVEDVERALRVASARGATLTSGIEQGELRDGRVRWFDIASPLGDTTFRFVQREGAGGMFPGLVRTGSAPPTSAFGVQALDHLTSNFLTLRPAVRWMEEVLGFERYWDVAFHTEDVRAELDGGSGLRSTVMWDPVSGIKLANNEPAAPAYHASQIYRFCQEHRGPGVQHVALAVTDILRVVGSLRARGVDFMPTPGTYYDRLPARLRERGIGHLEEPLETLRAQEVLVDGEGGSYLLQIFLREAASLFDDPDAGPLFIELIERKGDRGFGAGNFRALFESIERQQADHAPDGRPSRAA